MKLSFLPLLLLFLSLSACQQEKPQEKEPPQLTDAEIVKQEPVEEELPSKRRPAPAFHRIPTEMAQNRVYVCDDRNDDLFHTVFDCEKLTACTAVMKNTTLIRAVEDYDRYNCEVCSSDLAVIFDEQKIINQ